MIFESSIPVSLGDTICIKSHLDAEINKNKFEEIRIEFYRPLVASAKNNDPAYHKFLDDMAELFFSQAPYVYVKDSVKNYPFRDQYHVLSDYGLKVQKPSLPHLLCQGKSLQITDYVVLTTKLRYLSRELFQSLSTTFFQILNKIAQKYKIVILGEREVEDCEEYRLWKVFGIYPELIANLPSNQIVDLTIPALGITSPVLSQVKQDCLILQEAKLVISLGIGGNFCMALASEANVVGLRQDDEPITNDIFLQSYPHTMITKQVDQFLVELERYT